MDQVTGICGLGFNVWEQDFCARVLGLGFRVVLDASSRLSISRNASYSLVQDYGIYTLE